MFAIKKPFGAVLAAVFLGGCVAAQDGQPPDPAASAVGGAIGGALGGAILCELQGKDDCKDHIIAGAAVGAVAGYLLNKRQQAIYAAAQKNNVDAYELEYTDADGNKSADVMLEGDFFEHGNSAALSDSGRKKLETVLSAGRDAEPGEKTKVQIVYNPDSAGAQILAEERARRMRRTLPAENLDFGTVALSNEENAENTQQFIIR